jgi:phosphate transport system protein
LGALIFRNAAMAGQVLESDDLVDQYRDRIFEQLLELMTQKTALVAPSMQFILATRHLERIADHATNIAEDIIYWVRGLDVRHGRAIAVSPVPASVSEVGSEVGEDSYGPYSGFTAATDTERA